MKILPFCLLICLMALSVQAQTEQPVKTGMAEVNGARLYYEIAGEGQPLVFLSGGGGNHRRWDDQFMGLSKRFRVLRYDNRCIGKSTISDYDVVFSDYEDVKDLLDHLGIEKAHICGSSTAVDFAIAYPDKCLSLIVLGPWVNGYRSPAYQSYIEGIVRPWHAIFKEKGIVAAADYFFDCEGVYLKPKTREIVKQMFIENSFYWDQVDKIKRHNLKPSAVGRLKEINVPTLIITAETDLDLCGEVADLMEREIAGAKKVMIKGAGHYMYIDNPKEFNGVVEKFIGDIVQKKAL